MLVDSYSEIKEFFSSDNIGTAISEANDWCRENHIIATSITINIIEGKSVGFVNGQDKNRVIIIYNIKEPLNAVGEAAKERMPKDIPYIPKGKPEGARHH